jgi:hypothetical protein
MHAAHHLYLRLDSVDTSALFYLAVCVAWVFCWKNFPMQSLERRWHADLEQSKLRLCRPGREHTKSSCFETMLGMTYEQRGSLGGGNECGQ